MNRYEEYKDSGIFWNPKIPKVWNVYRLGNVIQKENRPRPIDGELLVCTNKGTVIPRGEAKIGLIADSEDIYQGVSKGDLLIHGMDTWHGAIATSSMDGYCTPVVHVCTSKCNNVSFVKYYMRHMAFQKVFKIISNGVRQNTSDFRSWEKVRTIPIPLPPLPEQQSIVTYLDEKVGKIDACIEARKKEIDLLNESKKAIIADAVTHGLNPDAEMKDSGIPWIDIIPAHWEVKMLRNYLYPFSEKGHPQEQLLSVTRERGVIVRNAESKEENHNYIPDDLGAYKYVEKGDFVINKMKSWQGSYGLSDYQGIVSPAYYTCKLKNVCKEFFSVAVRSYPYISFFAAYSKGIRVGQWDLPIEALKMIPFIEPPLDEQRKIYDFIKSKTAKIDSTISYMQSQIEELKEYKQRLISDVVTGQKKV